MLPIAPTEPLFSRQFQQKEALVAWRIAAGAAAAVILVRNCATDFATVKHWVLLSRNDAAKANDGRRAV